jgi:hypothetical protein
MDALTFLKSLPAVLGVVGFFAYLWAGQYRIGGDLMKGVVEKLRAAPNVDIQNYATLTPARIERLIERDAAVRRAVNSEDRKLIRLIVILHNIVTVIVLLVCAALVGAGVWLISRPDPLLVIPHEPSRGLAGLNGELLVDLDPLKVEWDTTGEVDKISVFLENVETGARTVEKTVLADVRTVSFDADEVHRVATVRTYHGKNRIRSVVAWPGHEVRSKNAVNVFVGVKVRLMVGGTLVTPNETRSINTLYATIDDSTEQMPSNYCFAVDFAGWSTTGSVLVAPLKSCNSKAEVSLQFLPEVDWARHAGLVLNQPLADRALTRLCIAGPEYDDDNC